MQANLRTYTNKDRYLRDYPDEITPLKSIKEGIKIARDRIANVRGTNKFIGFKITDKFGELKHKLPSN